MRFGLWVLVLGLIKYLFFVFSFLFPMNIRWKKYKFGFKILWRRLVNRLRFAAWLEFGVGPDSVPFSFLSLSLTRLLSYNPKCGDKVKLPCLRFSFRGILET